MYGLNKAQLIGHVGADPELRTTDSGNSVVSFTLATNESYKDANGTLVEKTEWHRITAWRKLAEVIAEHVKKGTKLYVEGKLETRKYEKDGQDHYSTQIVLSDFVFLSPKQDADGDRSPRALEPPAPESDLPF